MSGSSDNTEISKRLGQTIRVRRKVIGKTIQEVADAASLSVGFISQVERGMSAPSLTSFFKISRALDTSMEALLETPREYRIATRKGEREIYDLGDARRTYESLGPGFAHAKINACLVHRPAGHVSENFIHEGEEFIYLMQGAVEYLVDGVNYRLNSGDTLHFESSKPHYSIVGDIDVVELSICTMPIYEG